MMRGFVRTLGLIAAALLCVAPEAHAQGCVLCYTSLANLGPGAMKAFELAMLALLIPALILFAGVFLFIFLRARSASSTPGETVPLMAALRLKFASFGTKTADGRI